MEALRGGFRLNDFSQVGGMSNAHRQSAQILRIWAHHARYDAFAQRRRLGVTAPCKLDRVDRVKTPVFINRVGSMTCGCSNMERKPPEVRCWVFAFGKLPEGGLPTEARLTVVQPGTKRAADADQEASPGDAVPWEKDPGRMCYLQNPSFCRWNSLFHQPPLPVEMR